MATSYSYLAVPAAPCLCMCERGCWQARAHLPAQRASQETPANATNVGASLLKGTSSILPAGRSKAGPNLRGAN
jgi:hypothetical protein